MEPGRKLRQALEGSTPALGAVIGDALTARLAEMAGYDVAAMSSAPVANQLLGLPDSGMVTLAEMEFVTSRAAAACGIPLLVDAETGYGNALSMMRTVRTFDQAGAAGVFIEDQQFPPRAAGGPVISTEEMVGKIKAAADARVHESFLIIARTDAAQTEGLEAGIERAQAYVDAGAEGFFFAAALTDEERARVLEEIAAPYHFAILSGRHTYESLTGFGYSCVMAGHAPTHAGALTTLQRLEEVRRTGVSGDETWQAESAGTVLEGWERGEHGQISLFDTTALRERYLPEGTY